MKVLLDVNVVIDVLERRPEFFDDSDAALHLVTEGVIDGCFAAGSAADIYYILRRAGSTPSQARALLTKLVHALDMCDTTPADVTDALALPMPDFEDAVLAACAQRIAADVIVTRDLHDFANSPVPALSPAQVVSRFAESGDQK